MRRQQRILTIYLVLVLVFNPVLVAGKITSLSGFKEVKTEKYDKDTLHTYIHQKSGLKLTWIQNKDVNKAFTLGVRTPTTDDTGVNHIIEHTLFTGSLNYPSSSLFFDASSTYPCTYMNALTSGDMTIFPFATPYKACYEALLPIYLDAIFKPNFLESPYGFYEESFYRIPEEDKYGGVVYNEMKGAYGSIDRTIYRQIRKMVFKDSHYAYDSGGDPVEIPKLTYQHCVDTYNRYYYPGNMRVIIYGDLPIEKTLHVIAQYLNEYSEPNKPIDLGVSTLNPVHKGVFKVLPTTKGCSLVKSFVLDQAVKTEDLEELDLWMTAYLMAASSPFQQMLNKQGLHAKWLKDDDLPYAIYTLVINDLPEDKLENCSQLVESMFDKLTYQNYTNSLLEQDLLKESKWIFEKQEESNNRGIYIAQELLDGWAHGGEEQQYYIKKKKLMDKKEINLKVRDLLVEAQCYTLFLMPQEVADYTEVETVITDEEWEDIGAGMKAWQMKKYELAPIALETLMIPIEEVPHIKRNKEYWEMETRVETNLARSQIYLNTSHIPQEELNDLFLYSYLLEESAKDISPFSGSLVTSCTAYPLKQGYWPCFQLSITTLPEETEHGTLFEEARISLLNRPRSWYHQKLAEFVMNIQASTHNNPIGTLASLCTAGEDDRSNYVYASQYPFYCYCEQLSKQSDIQWISKVKAMDRKLYHKNGIILSTTLGKKQKNLYKKSWQKEIDSFVTQPNTAAHYNIKVPQGNCMIITPIKVDHSFKAIYKPEGIDGIDYIIASCLTKNHLNPQIRVVQGAYGAGCQVNDPKTLGMYAYRAPDYTETLKTMVSSSYYLSQIDEKILEKGKTDAISKVHQNYRLLDPSLDRVAVMERLILWGRSPKEIMHFQQQIIMATLNDIRKRQNFYNESINKGKVGIITSKNYTEPQNFTIYRY